MAKPNTHRSIKRALGLVATIVIVQALSMLALFAVGYQASKSLPTVVDGGHVITQTDCDDGTAWNHSNCPKCLRDDPGRFDQTR
jgi:hypothetical protein